MRLSKPGLAIGLACVLWAFWFARLAIMSWDGFWFGVFDVGIFHQGTWLISEGLEPFVTLRGLHLLGDHSSYILYLVAPLYWVWTDINFLVVMAVLIPASAALVSYRIGLAEGLKPWTAVAVSVMVLLHPAFAWTTWDSFHPETFAILLIPLAYLMARKNRPLLFVLFGVLLLLVKEDAVFVAIPLAAYVGLKWERLRMVSAGLVLFGAGVAVLNFRVMLPGFSPTGDLIYSGRYSTDLTPLVTSGRFGYLVAMLLPTVIALRAPFLLAVAGPITVANIASLHGYQHEIRYHYTAYLLGVLAAAAPVGMAKLRDKYGGDVKIGLLSDSRRVYVPILLPLLALAVAGLVMFGPSLTFQGNWGAASVAEQELVYGALEQIPDDAAVAASYTFAPHLAERSRIYMLPNPWQRDYYGVADGAPPLPDPNSLEWMVVDRNIPSPPTEAAIEQAMAAGWMEVISEGRLLVLRSP